MAAGSRVLDTATRVTLAGSRPAARAAETMRARTVANRPDMDASAEAGDEGIMILSNDARRLWDTALRMKALALARRERDVSAPGACPRAALPPMLVFTDPGRLPRPWDIAARLPPGAGLVYRAFGAADAVIVAERLRAITHARGVTLLIGRDAALADRVGADGVHLPERALSAAYALGGTRPHWLLTGAVHSVDAAGRTRDLDGLVLSPVFPAGGSSSQRPALGPAALAEACRLSGTPVYALGGIDADRAETLVDSGACGIAGIDAFARAFAPDQVRI